VKPVGPLVRLLRRWNKCFEEAFIYFCRDIHPRLVGALSLYCGDPNLAEDLAQEALAIAYRDWTKVERAGDQAGWVFRVGFNLCNSYFRRKAAERRARARIPQTEQVMPDLETDEALAIRHSVASLPRRQRTAVVLRFFADYSVAETARLMDCPEATVKTLTRRGLAALRLQEEVRELREVKDVG
jgi:RNA polymerase sigma factor (sigma-70 family)